VSTTLPRALTSRSAVRLLSTPSPPITIRTTLASAAAQRSRDVFMIDTSEGGRLLHYPDRILTPPFEFSPDLRLTRRRKPMMTQCSVN
jgi:hypothetical protein